jgi:GT2 family glycosyltransferase
LTAGVPAVAAERPKPARDGITVIYVTHRVEPHFEWFVDSLAPQLDDTDVEVLFVDGLHSAARGARLAELVAGRFPFRHVPAKPTPYNGPHRLTRREYLAAASARNTGIVYATKPYAVFVDDSAVVMPGWWTEVCEAARDGYVVAGAYQKHWEMVVDRGTLVRSRVDPSGIDTRWDLGGDSGTVPMGGAQLYGSSFGVPRELLLAVGGLDELCDTIGGEDYHLGVRLEWSGAPIRYNRRMLTIESEESHRGDIVLLRIDKKLGPDAYMARLREFGVTGRSTDGNWDSSHLILDILFGTRNLWPIGNYYVLNELTASHLPALVQHFPRHYWFDRRPLADM